MPCATVLLLPSVFTVVNAALFVLKRRAGEQPGEFELPAIVPLFGAVLCVVILAVHIASGDIKAPLIAGILGLYLVSTKAREKG